MPCHAATIDLQRLSLDGGYPNRWPAGRDPPAGDHLVRGVGSRRWGTYNPGHSVPGPALPAPDPKGASHMAWTKPEFTVVAVTLEVTAYAGKK